MKTVYWAHVPIGRYQALTAYDPQSTLKRLSILCSQLDGKSGDLNIIPKCPAVTSSLKNTFDIRSFLDYSLIWEEDQIKTMHLDQEMFDLLVTVRALAPKGCASFGTRYIFFCDEDLEMIQQPALFSDSDFSTKTMLIPGAYNIGKWFRPIEAAIIFNKQNQIVNINRGDLLYTVKFNTKERVKLKQFYITPELRELAHSCMDVKDTCPMMRLDQLYKMFKDRYFTKRILRLIKANLVD